MTNNWDGLPRGSFFGIRLLILGAALALSSGSYAISNGNGSGFIQFGERAWSHSTADNSNGDSASTSGIYDARLAGPNGNGDVVNDTGFKGVPTPTPSPTQSSTATETATASPTASPSPTETADPSATSSPVPTSTNTPGSGPISTPTNTPIGAPTATPSETPTIAETPTNTAIGAPTATPSETPTVTETPTNTAIGAPTATPSETQTVTETPTQTEIGAPTATPSSTSPAATPTETALGALTATPSAVPSRTLLPGEDCDSGYYLLDSFGGRHRVGNPVLIAGPVYFGTDVARDMERTICDEPSMKLIPPATGTPDLVVLDSLGAVHIVQNPACQVAQDFYFAAETYRAVDVEITADASGFWVLADTGSIWRAGSTKDPSDPALLAGTDLGVLGTDIPVPDRDPNLAPGGVSLRAVSFIVIDEDHDGRAEGYVVLDSNGGRFHFNGDGSQVTAGSSAGLSGNEPGRLLDPEGYVWPFFPGLDIARDMELHPSQGGVVILDGWDGIHPVPVDVETNPVFFANNVVSATDSTPAQSVGMPYVTSGFDDPNTAEDETVVLDIDGASIFADLEFSAGCPGAGLYTLDRFGGVFVLGDARPDDNQPVPDYGNSPYFFPFLYAEDMELFSADDSQPGPTPTVGPVTKFNLFEW